MYLPVYEKKKKTDYNKPKKAERPKILYSTPYTPMGMVRKPCRRGHVKFVQHEKGVEIPEHSAADAPANQCPLAFGLLSREDYLSGPKQPTKIRIIKKTKVGVVFGCLGKKKKKCDEQRRFTTNPRIGCSLLESRGHTAE